MSIIDSLRPAPGLRVLAHFSADPRVVVEGIVPLGKGLATGTRA